MSMVCTCSSLKKPTLSSAIRFSLIHLSVRFSQYVVQGRAAQSYEQAVNDQNEQRAYPRHWLSSPSPRSSSLSKVKLGIEANLDKPYQTHDEKRRHQKVNPYEKSVPHMVISLISNARSWVACLNSLTRHVGQI